MGALAPLALPIDEVLPEIARRIAKEPSLVIEAPPGAGKTTRVPRALLDVAEVRGEIVVLEPRRLAAKMAARRVAEEMGESVGETVGYSVRFEESKGPRTRVRFVTEGVLLRRAQSNRDLAGVGAVVLDEFHERHVHGDVALALVRQLQRTIRQDLRVIVMSATLDAGPVRAFLGCEGVRSMGRMFDVAIEHEDAPDDRPLHLRVASAVRKATGDPDGGDVLVFLPGAAEIRRAQEACEAVASQRDLLVLPLHGELPAAEQDRAVRKADRRKVVLSTNVAESSLTIDGVGVVIDSGLVKRAGFAAWSGMPTLKVEKASKASLAQRAGRAGRTRQGRCIRLFSRADEQSRPAHETPELLRVDLSQVLLELAASDMNDVTWLDAPPAAAVERSRELLSRLGALDERGAITPTGKRMARFPAHPRLARAIVEGERRGVTDDACLAAAILGERDFFGRTHDMGRTATQRSDVSLRVDVFRQIEASRFSSGAMRAHGIDPGAMLSVSRAYDKLRAIADPARNKGSDDDERDLGVALLAGYPDRVARRVRERSLALSGGGSATLAPESAVREAPLLVALEAEERPGAAMVRLASAIEPEWLIDVCADRIEETTELSWNDKSERVAVWSKMTYDGLVLSESRENAPPSEAASRVLAQAAEARGLRTFAPEGELDALLLRAKFAKGVDASLPEVDEAAAKQALYDLCEGATTFAEIASSSLVALLRAKLGAQAARLDRVAPERVTLAGGRSVKVHYEAGKPPWIASRLQDFFGMKKTPSVGDGRVPLVLHLLAPNQRAVQVTSDLEGFWTKHYPEIRKELSRRYPRHAWPENPG